MSTVVEVSRAGEMDKTKMDLWWGLAVLTGLGDLVTTRIGLQLGLEEGNHLIVLLLETTGWAGFTLFKIAILAGALLFATKLSAEKQPAVPLGLAATWSFVTVINTIHVAALLPVTL
jgi:hypothetical protein